MSDEKPCCLCGDWFGPADIFVFDESVLHKDIRRRFICGSLKEKFLCRGCQTRCDGCKQRIIYQQKRQYHGRCLPCSSKKR